MRNKMGSIYITLKEGETWEDLVQELTDEYAELTGNYILEDEKMFFRAILPERDDGERIVKVDFFYDKIFNPCRLYSAEEIAYKLLCNPTVGKHAIYVQPDLSLWFEMFDGVLNQMTTTVQPRYEKLIPTFDELKSSLCYVVVQLYNKGYYLSRPLIFKAFVNQLNMEVRKTKLFQNMVNLHDPIDDLDEHLTVEDMLEDPDSTKWAEDTRHISEEEFDEELLKKVKKVCLTFMSPLRYERMLLQIKTKTISGDVAKDLQKLRVILGSKRFKKEGK